MRTFVIRARSGTTRWDRVKTSVGGKGHMEVIAHCVMNAFFISNGFREDVVVNIILDSAQDFPRTIQLSKGISFEGFHEDAILSVIENVLRESEGLQKNESRMIAHGLHIHGYGFEKCVGNLLETNPVYLLDKKGEDIRQTEFENNPVFVLSDHLAMPKNNVKSFTRRGMKSISLGKKMLFASQCVVLIQDELDRRE